MISVDANILIYTVDSNSLQHAAARSWPDGQLNEAPRVGLSWTCFLAFVRIITNRARRAWRQRGPKSALGWNVRQSGYRAQAITMAKYWIISLRHPAFRAISSPMLISRHWRSNMAWKCKAQTPTLRGFPICVGTTL